MSVRPACDVCGRPRRYTGPRAYAVGLCPTCQANVSRLANLSPEELTQLERAVDVRRRRITWARRERIRRAARAARPTYYRDRAETP